MIISKRCPKTGKNIINTDPNASIFKGEQARRFNSGLDLAGIQMSAATVDSVIAAAKRSTSKRPYLDTCVALHNSQNPATATATRPATIHRAVTAPAKTTAPTSLAKPNLTGYAKVAASFAAKTTAPTPKASKHLTADEFKTPRQKMLRSEWLKLSTREKKRFSDQYGIVI